MTALEHDRQEFEGEANFTKLLLATSDASRAVESRATSGADGILDITYALRQANYDAADIAARLAALPDMRLLDVIQTLETAAAAAIGEGNTDAIEQIEDIFSELEITPLHAFAEYGLRLARQRIDQEKEEPTLPLFRDETAHPNEGRLNAHLPASLEQTSVDLATRIDTDETFPPGCKLLPIAKDAIGVLDNSNLLIKIGYCDVAALPATQPVSALHVKQLLSHVRALNEERLSLAIYTNTLNVINAAVMQPWHGERAATAWEETFAGHPTAAEWRTFFEATQAYDERRMQRAQEEHVIRQDVEAKCMAASDALLTDADRMIETLLQDTERSSTYPQAYFEQYRKYRGIGDPERALQALDKIAMVFKTRALVRRPLFSESQNLVDAHDAWLETHQQEYDHGKREKHEVYLKHVKELKKLRKEMETLPAILADMPEAPARLEKALAGVLAEIQTRVPHVEFQDVREAVKDPRLMPFPVADDEHVDILLQHLHRPELQLLLAEDLNNESSRDGEDAKLSDLKLLAQAQCGRMLRRCDRGEIRRIGKILSKTPRKVERVNMLASFLACAEDEDMRQMILQIAENTASAPEIFAAYAQVTETVIENARLLVTQRTEHDSGPDMQSLTRALLSRANDFLRKAYYTILYSDPVDGIPAVHELIEELIKEDARQSAARTFFRDAVGILKQKDVDLNEWKTTQQFILEAYQMAGAEAALLRALQDKDLLQPLPAITWLVDRPGSEYVRRLGVDLVECMRLWSRPDRTQIAFEFGHGNGNFKFERAAVAAAGNYMDLGMCDTLYYPLTPLIQRRIDWAKLERDIGMPVEPAERERIADFLYKILVIEASQTALDDFAYDKTVKQDLRFNANTITNHLERKAPLIATTDVVPDVISSRVHVNGEWKAVYPRKVAKPASPAGKEACIALGAKPAAYIRKDGDVYKDIPAYPPGTLVGDFTEIRNLQKKQIDLSWGLRSTMYIPPPHYTQFLLDQAENLTDDGLHYEDGLRGNDGKFYRLGEMLAVRRLLPPDMQLHLVIGPALENEDHCQDAEGVPLAFVITRSEAKLDDIREQLKKRGVDPRTGAGYRLVPIDEYLAAGNDARLAQLDPDGNTLRELNEMREHLRSLAEQPPELVEE